MNHNGLLGAFHHDMLSLRTGSGPDFFTFTGNCAMFADATYLRRLLPTGRICGSRRAVIGLGDFGRACCIWLLGMTLGSSQEPVKIWEYSPYQVEVWYAFDPQLNASELARQTWLNQLQAALERNFRAAWRVELKPLPATHSRRVLREFESFTLDSLQANELVLVLAPTHPDTQTLRTFEAAMESLSEVVCTAETKQQLDSAVAQLQNPGSAPVSQQLAQLVKKCAVDAEGADSLEQRLKSSAIPAALVPRRSVPQLAEAVRPLPTPLPWQTETLFRELDKLFFLWIGPTGDEIEVRARELDCPMQFMGPVISARTSDWPYSVHLASVAVSQAFAPVARVEEAESRTALLRLRAGGLVIDKHNPAAVAVGDVMQPVVRRDDRNGQPALLEPLAWTFAAITASDGVKMEANVYTYSGGPGLQGRQNRRTQRMLLKVRPSVEQTDIQLVVRDDGRPQAGSFVYRRDLLTEDFELLGRTDWRGRFTVRVPYDNGGILPEAIRYQRALAKKEAEAQAALAAESSPPAAELDSVELPAAAESPAAVAPPTPNDSAAMDPAVIPLRAPLSLIYIKNGDTVLAKLPMVPGLRETEIARLPDDTRRLKAEAFVRGFQGDILDMVGLRNLLAARIQLHLKNGKREAAQATLQELRQLKNYNEMADELEAIQRRMLDENAGPIAMSAKNRIDRMFQTTRNMLQKYLQDNLLSDSERAVSLP
jgi:hypothetical protein